MAEEKEKKKVALYIRVSTEEQVEMYGVDLQRSSLMGLIASKSQELEFAGEEYVYIDEGVSGSIPPEERPEFRRLIEDISRSSKKPFDVVAVYKIDRFARRLKLLLEVLDLFNTEENKIEFLSASESIDTSTPFGRAMLGIIGVIAELEMENIKDRTSSGRQASAEQGTFMNVPPLGYVKDKSKKIVIQEEEKEVVERIFYMYVRENRSLGYIARYLKEHKTKTPQAYRYYHKKEEQGNRKLSVGGQYSWDTSAVKNVLSNELYTGVQYFNKSKDGKKLPKEKWEYYEHNQNFIDKEVFELAQKLLSLNSRRRLAEVTKDRVYLLQGLLKCANCYNPTLHTEPYSWNGLSKTVKSTGNKSYYYACSTKHTHKKKLRGIDCKTIQIPAKPLEKHIIELIKQLIDNPQVVFKYQQELQSKKADIKMKKAQLKNVKTLLNKAEPTRKRILQSFEDGDYDRKTKNDKLKYSDKEKIRLEKEKEILESELSVFTHTNEYFQAFEIFKERYAEEIKKYTKDDDVDYFYGLAHMMIEEIIIFSRPKRKTDSVSGPKKKGQLIPYKLKIVLKIPSEMLGNLLYSLSPEAKLRAEKDGWWATQESNL